MPLYEFYSADTHKIYSFYGRRALAAGEVPRCPDGEGKHMERLISSFAVTGRAKEHKEPADAPDMDPRQEAELMKLAGEMSGMDEENPDPRQLGRLMRRMMDVTGEKMPEPMLEMLARMEKGEDPEKLEEEYGDLLGDEGSADAGMPDDEKSSASAIARRLPPRRDQTLYELSEYL